MGLTLVRPIGIRTIGAITGDDFGITPILLTRWSGTWGAGHGEPFLLLVLSEGSVGSSMHLL